MDTENNKYKKYETNIIKYLDDNYLSNKIKFNANPDEFIRKFTPFIHLVNYWSQLLCITIAKCDEPKIRGKLIKNLYDENCNELTHVDTFGLFIKEIDVNNICEHPIDIHLIAKSNIIFDSMNLITNFVESNDFNDVCQMLGAIEYTYHLISADINKYCADKLNIIPRFHYSIHEILDKEHSFELFEANNKKIKQENLEFGAKWIIESINTLLTSQ